MLTMAELGMMFIFTGGYYVISSSTIIYNCIIQNKNRCNFVLTTTGIVLPRVAVLMHQYIVICIVSEQPYGPCTFLRRPVNIVKTQTDQLSTCLLT